MTVNSCVRRHRWTLVPINTHPNHLHNYHNTEYLVAHPLIAFHNLPNHSFWVTTSTFTYIIILSLHCFEPQSRIYHDLTIYFLYGFYHATAGSILCLLFFHSHYCLFLPSSSQKNTPSKNTMTFLSKSFLYSFFYTTASWPYFLSLILIIASVSLLRPPFSQSNHYLLI